MTVQSGKCFKALIDSGAVISLMCTSVYNMIENHFKTSILPAVVNLRTADWSPISSTGKATLSLQIADCKFSYTFLICYRLPEADLLFGIDLHKWYCLSDCWDLDRHLVIQREGSFITYTRNRENLHNIALVKSTLKMVLYQLGSKDMIYRIKWHILLVLKYQEGT